MRKIHSILRLFFEAGLSIRATARTLRVSPEVPAKAGMGDYLRRRAKVVGLSWPLPEGIDERTLEARLFPGAGAARHVVTSAPGRITLATALSFRESTSPPVASG